MSKARRNTQEIHRREDIPRFTSEDAEARFWDSHAVGEDLWEQLPEPKPADLPATRPRTRPLAVRFDEATINRVKQLASRRNKGYQTLLKEFVIERLYEEEKREGIV